MSANSFLNKGGLPSLVIQSARGATSETWFNNVQLWFDEIKNIFLSSFFSICVLFSSRTPRLYSSHVWNGSPGPGGYYRISELLNY